mmetsp:Transcript_13621/g.23191  ORF Transcript_13621/g.23191 Transcript_13621/m.23191 type:complete len:141 (+) Transcript_13621:578-1000(+)
MDLGAPILDAQAGNTPIISDGVVSAPGYDPIKITNTASNQGYTGSDETFTPDIDIIKDETTSYDKVIVEREQEVESEDSNSSSDKKKQVVYKEEETSSIFIIVMGLTIVLSCAGVLAYKLKQRNEEVLHPHKIKSYHTPN